MIAAENGALPRGKVGGMGDVVRDLPRALVKLGHRVTVLTPAYGMFARLPGAKRIDSIDVPFAGRTESVDRFTIPSGVENLDYQVVDHPRFTPSGDERIYHDDGAAAPFATDATKFAFFSAASAALVAALEPRPDVVHLHDWHVGFYLLLRAHDRRFKQTQSVRTVFTIHNLALQGVRPLRATDSSLAGWFPDMTFPLDVVADPRHRDCVNPLAVAIRLADTVNTVSPTYADEIVEPNDERTGRRGGESLEHLLAARRAEGALVGILNGCEYMAEPPPPSWKRLLRLLGDEVLGWIAAGTHVDSAAFLAERRLAEWPKKRPPIVATSIGRLTEQKLGLMRQPVSRSATALDRVAGALDEGVLIVLGSGERDYEQFLLEASLRHQNLLFLKGYSDRLSAALYGAGDLFLMPSVFEPCGISQMLAMRAGQPCVAHAVGGLKDTVTTSNGFPFAGETMQQKAQNFAREVAAAVDVKLYDPDRWQALVANASAERFTWERSAMRYAREVYAFD
ncbi:MAG: glycogen/starch synthase [Gammaproteobacteria bacterium]|nr:glycogen/starch synthase [Gammaproteobacteria bacterium]